jgi:eukaryotic-like serine/threonine-protein kinase
VPEAPDFEACVVVRRLKQGPLYDLYLARHSELERLVLIKSVQGVVAQSSPMAQALEREARLLGRLDHHNIVRVLDFVRRPDRVWLVLEYDAGVSLAELLEQRATIDPRAACVIALGLARALAHVHSAGIVHNAVSPANVWLTQRGRVRLSNFEHAESAAGSANDDALQATAAGLETAYLSPEQVLGAPARPESDVFSLGSLLYRMLAGRLPFEAADPAALRQAIHRDTPAALASSPGISPALSRLLQRCLEQEPEQRFEDGGALELALDAVLERPAEGELEAGVLGVLARAGQSGQSVPAPPLEARAAREAAERSLRRSLIALLVTSLVMLAGGLVFHQTVRLEAPRVEVHENLPPAAYGALRVVAEPWAYVYVDGKLMETTPFANPLLLTPGRHHLRLEHPSATPERREVELAPGQSVLIEVSMKLSGVSGDAGAAPPPNLVHEGRDAGRASR